jgi:RimJ/RimL family protein N-acetyltransferase/mannose-6-phosphate isomerase-like protein (cupin superfamily)
MVMLIRRVEAKEFGFHGVTVADYGATAEGTASVAMVDVPPGGRHPFAYSSRCEKLYLVIEGKVRFSVDGVLYDPQVRDLLIVPKGKVFRYENEGGGAASVLLVHVPAFDAEAEHLLPDRMREHEVHLRGGRVALRPMTEEDWEHVLAWNGDPEVLIWADCTEEVRPEEDTKDIYRSVSQSAFVFIIEHEGQPIGECWLQQMNLPEIVERFPGKDLRRIDIMIGRKDLWGKGLGTDTIRTLVRFGFEEENAEGIFGLVDPKNRRSWRAFEKAGMEEFEPIGDWGGLVVWRGQAGTESDRPTIGRCDEARTRR